MIAVYDREYLAWFYALPGNSYRQSSGKKFSVFQRVSCLLIYMRKKQCF